MMAGPMMLYSWEAGAAGHDGGSEQAARKLDAYPWRHRNDPLRRT
jgi:hypothetical protein